MHRRGSAVTYQVSTQRDETLCWVRAAPSPQGEIEGPAVLPSCKESISPAPRGQQSVPLTSEPQPVSSPQGCRSPGVFFSITAFVLENPEISGNFVII